jgi:hypothetical protein
LLKTDSFGLECLRPHLISRTADAIKSARKKPATRISTPTTAKTATAIAEPVEAEEQE